MPSLRCRSLSLVVFLLLFCPCATMALAAPLRVLEVRLEGALTPAVTGMFVQALTQARDTGMDAVLLRLDTPGGAIDAMRPMVAALLASPVPVVAYVSPAGARAVSAGVFLMAAATVAAMAPGTTIGSASPVGLGGSDLGKTMRQKITHDLKSQLRAVLALRGRNVTWYLDSVANAANLAAQEAVSQKVVEYLAVDAADLWTQIGKRGLPSDAERRFFSAAEVETHTFVPGLRYRLLSWMLEPTIAYLLLMAGIIGLFFEMVTPGAIFPGVFGGMCLLVALYALSLLPTTTTGVLLLLLAGVLFLVEVHVVSYGLLGVSGVICLGLGSLLLFDDAGMVGVSPRVIAPTVLVLGLLVAAALRLVVRSQHQKPRMGLAALVGQRAVVRTFRDGCGKVFVHGEIWNAVSRGPVALLPGDPVVIVAASDMQLLVEPVADNAPQSGA